MMGPLYIDELMHYGIPGMKWGVRNGPPYPLKPGAHSDKERAYLNLKKARVSNLDKWGKDPDHNILFIAGYSGSGKSTSAIGLKKRGDTVIHLDGYTENDNSTIRDKNFTKYLDKKVPGWKVIYKATKETPIKRHSKEYWNYVDDFLKAIEGYSKIEYAKGNRVIVEGVQIADGWLSNKKYFSDKPLVILSTNAMKSFYRGRKRDDMFHLKKWSAKDAKEYIQWYRNTHENLDELAKETRSRRGRQAIESLFS